MDICPFEEENAAEKIKTFLCFAVKMEEAVSMEMENHEGDKDEGCYDNTEATFSDDEEEVNNKGKQKSKLDSKT